ncbi:MAG: YggS family pyridoxal phosphate-dependent enzyme [Myxococcales bacterium]|nr:YggS family pyridoxal phosphate-dependent enzyme [Myxococcales bacterium]
MIEQDSAGFVLASGSPRRRAMLRGAGLSPAVAPADIDETPQTGEDPAAFAARMAREKAAAVARATGRPALGCDTVVTLDGRILGKPVDDADAVTMLTALAGRTHAVVSAWAICDPQGVRRAGASTTMVRFRAATRAELEDYVATGEPLDKAGGYGIQGEGMRLVDDYSGDYLTVVGMPLGDVLDGLIGEGLIAPRSPMALRVATLRGRIAAGCDACGRDPAAVTLVGASKAQPVEALRAAVAAGVVDLGENYVQEWIDKADAVAGARWHFIGRVQRNKAKPIAQRAALVHGVDAARTAEALGRAAIAAGRVLPMLVQVDLAGEPSKGGVAPEGLAALLDAIAGVAGVRCEGLMALPPDEGLAAARVRFAALRALRDAHATAARPLPLLSMGMSGDFDAAVAEGATHVRVGTALFGPRPSK